MRFLPLTQGRFAIVDDADFEKVGRFKWCAHRTRTGRFYAKRWLAGKNHFLHTAIMGMKGVDHKNGNGLDCCRENMRPATNQQNQRAFIRKRPGASSSYRGVSWNKKNQKWIAQIRKSGVNFYLGSFKDEKEAATAYDKKARELGFFKEALNFP